jgi:acylphosphatase
MAAMADDVLRKQVHGTIRGRVQGVGFRYFAQQVAAELGVTGWVKNNYDGSVEFLAQGTDEKIEAFLRNLSRGPASASVQDMQVRESSITREYASFNIRF